MLRVLYLVALGVAGALALRAFAFERIVIVSGSMEPTLPVGTRVMVNKFIYKLWSPARGDIVSFVSPVERKELVKRLIAVGGDEVRIIRKEVHLNGRPLAEPYVQHTRPDVRFKDDDLDFGRVPPGHVVVMGDNRDESGDSRDWKNKAGQPAPFVPVQTIEGKVMAGP